MAVRVYVPIYLPGWLHKPLKRAKRALFPPPPVIANIDGERHVEWSFLAREMPDGPGEALEFGCEHGFMSLVAAQKGFHVVAADLEQQYFLWKHPNVEFQLGDFLRLDLPKNYFDIIINCSSVEHVGVAGRYGIKAERSEGDIEVMRRFADILKPGGKVLMTAPCGRDALMAPWCRVYGSERLPRLVEGFQVEKEEFWCKDGENRWAAADKEDALSYEPRNDPANPHGCSYALAGIVLRKPLAMLGIRPGGLS